MSDEDALASRIIERNDEKPYSTSVEPEVHYNHYGSRGVVDLVATNKLEPSQSDIEELRSENPLFSDEQIRRRHTETTINVYELKSSAAVGQATGANEIIRQFNRHKEYFFEGSSYNRHDYDNIYYSLVFYYDDATYRHVCENEALYGNLANGYEINLLYDHPQANNPIVVVGGDCLLSRSNIEQHLGLTE